MNLREKKGSISIFVLVALLFMAGFLIISFASNVNKSKTIKEQFNIISGIYSYTNGDEGAYDKAYTDLRNKNKQTMTATSEGLEDTSTLELTKTFEESTSNYRIYGNSIQDKTKGNPSPTNPVEIQSVGNYSKNILDINKFKNCTIEDTEVIIKDSYDTIVSKMSDIFEPNTTYYIHCEREYSTTRTNSTGSIANVGGLGVLLEYTHTDGSFTTGDTVSGSLYFYGFASGEVKFKNLYIGKEPYEEGNLDGKYRVPILVRGKNLLNHNTVKNSNVYIISSNGGELTPSSTGGTWRTSDYIYITENKTYHLNAINNNANTAGIAWYNAEKKYISGLNFLTVNKNNGNMTAPIGARYLKISWRIDEGYNPNWKNTVQLEEGTTETEFVTYKEQKFSLYLDEPLRKVGNVADYIDFKTGEVVRKIKSAKVYADNFYNYNPGGDKILTTIKAYYSPNVYEDSNIDNIYNTNNMSNMFRYLIGSSVSFITDTSGEVLALRSKGMYVTINADKLKDYTDLEEVKSYINNLGAYIIYELQTPIKTSISLPQLKTFEDYTKIEVLTNIAPSNIEVEYQGYTLD